MARVDETGYDPAEDEPDEKVEWLLERADRFYSSGHKVVASVLRNGLSAGLLYLRDEQEYNYLKARIDGTQRRERKKEDPDA